MIGATPDPADRLFAAVRRMVSACLPSLKFQGVWEYESIGVVGGQFAGKCTDPAAGMPDISAIQTLPSMSGATATWPTTGTRFLVVFANADPSKARVVSADPSQTPATVQSFAQTLVQLGDNTAVAITKSGPMVTFFNALQTWSAAVAAALSSAGFPIAGAQAAFTTAVATASSAIPTTKTAAS